MDLIQSNDVSELFSVTYSDCKITINVLSGGDKLHCFITINGLPIGKYDLFSTTSLNKGYKYFVTQFKEPEKYFEDGNQFIDVFLHIGNKLKNQDFVIQHKEQDKAMTDEGKQFLTSSDLIDRMDYIQRRTTEDPLVECYEDILRFNLIIISCKTSRPITYEHTGESSSGKTWPANHAVNGYSSEMVPSPAGMTGKAGKYSWDYHDLEKNEYVNKTGEKCIYFREGQDNREAVEFFKQMMSHDDDRLEFDVPMKNAITGVMETAKFVLDGIASFIILSVVPMDKDEMSTRTMKGSPKVTPKKTEKVITRTFKGDTKIHLWKPPRDLPIMQHAMFCLKKYKRTVNIFASILGDIFPKDSMRRARDMNRLRGFISACTALHQLQRSYQIIDDEDVLFSSFEDNLIALILFDNIFEMTMLGMSEHTIKIYEVMKDMNEMDMELTEKNIHERVEAENIHIKFSTLKENHITVLENHRFIEVKNKGRGKKAREYIINKRVEDLSKTPKLTPLFIKGVQDNFVGLIDGMNDHIKNMIKANVSPPVNVMRKKGAGKDIINQLFGMNYFHTSKKRNVLWKICDPKMRRMLFKNNHVLKGDEIDVQDMTKLMDEKKKAIDEIMSGESADEFKDLLALGDSLALEISEDEKARIKEWESGSE
jgi:hypothetical protein